jgi:hypothetical protein
MSLIDLSAWVTVITGPLALLGIGLAWLQLRRTADATEATKEAVERTARGLALYQLLGLLPQLHQHESDLDAAVEAKDGRRAVEVLNQWRRTGTEVRGLLDSRTDTEEELITMLQESFTEAYQAKSRLLREANGVEEATIDVRRAIGEVSVRVGSLTGRIKANIGGDVA